VFRLAHSEPQNSTSGCDQRDESSSSLPRYWMLSCTLLSDERTMAWKATSLSRLWRIEVTMPSLGRMLPARLLRHVCLRLRKASNGTLADSGVGPPAVPPAAGRAAPCFHE